MKTNFNALPVYEWEKVGSAHTLNNNNKNQGK